MQHPPCIQILVAEDNVINQILFTKMLSMLGYEADVAINGINALKACQTKTYDMVLMDYQMPGKDGVESAKSIKMLKRKKKPIIILMTANLLVNNDYLNKPGIIDDFLKKPFTLQEVKMMIEKWQPTFTATSITKTK